ncbi:hypothetical protein Mapa_014487 [Marchantia paleacea]|nr:hypothetical protein Mapa_014487 [Marchantia paleacea]
MLSQSKLIGRLQANDRALCLIRKSRTTLGAVLVHCTQQRGSHTCIKRLEVRKHGEGIDLSIEEYLCIKSRSLDQHKPYGRVLEKKSGPTRIRPSGVVPSLTLDVEQRPQERLSQPRIKNYHYSIYSDKSSDALLWKSAKTISLGRLQSRPGQRVEELNFLENVEECFSRSSSMSLFPQHIASDREVTAAASQSESSAIMPAAAPTELEMSEQRRRRGPETTLTKLWRKKREARRIGSLILLNGLAAVYGSSNVANRYVAEAAPALPASLTSLVRFSSAFLFFIPALVSAVKNREIQLLRAGAELGIIAFAACFVDSCNPGQASSSSSIPSLLFAFTVIFVPLMEVFSGRQSSPKLTRFATLAAAILGMGILEEEGVGWKGVTCPQISDLWGVAVAAISALHIFRSEAHGDRFDPLRLSGVQFGVLAILSLGWEVCSACMQSSSSSNCQNHQVFANFGGPLDMWGELQSIPWFPLLYNGLVCSGLSSWLELRGLRSVHASTATLVYTTIPVWGAFLSYFTSHDVPTDSAIMGGLVIAVTSIYAQIISTDEDRKTPSSSSTPLPPSPLKSTDISMKSFSTTSSSKNADEGSSSSGDPDYFPAGLLTSQLKFPYYAAQAKGLLAEIKLKLGALKSLGFIFTGASTNSLLSASPITSGSSSAAPLTTTTTGSNNFTASHISPTGGPGAPVDVAAAAAHTTITGGGLHFPIHPVYEYSTMSTMAHNVSGLLGHVSKTVTSGLESALIAAGSDIMQAVDIASVAERMLQGGAENAVHVVAGALFTTVGSLSIELTQPNLVDGSASIAEAANFAHTVSESPVTNIFGHSSHVVGEILSALSHLILPLIDQ